MSGKEPTLGHDGVPADAVNAHAQLSDDATESTESLAASLAPDTVQDSMDAALQLPQEDAVKSAAAPRPSPTAVVDPPLAATFHSVPEAPPAPPAAPANSAVPVASAAPAASPGAPAAPLAPGAPALSVPAQNLVPSVAAAPGLIAPSAPAGAPAPTVPGVPVTTAETAALDETPPGKVRRAREAGLLWAATPLRKRIAAIRKVRERILSQAERIAQVLNQEIGKPIEEAALAEVLPNADLVSYWCEVIEEFTEAVPVELDGTDYPKKKGRVRQDPRGVVALVTPWNYPIAIPLRSLIPTLLSGNAVVWKPSEVAPASSKLVMSLFEGLLPPNVLTLVEGGPEAGQSLVDCEIDLVVFTGSVKTGKAIAVRCAERLIPTSLELGGKDAAIVLKDANLEKAARGVVWGAFTNHGQNCAAIERVYVEAPIAAAFTKRVVELTKALTPADLGRMTTLAQHRIVSAHVADARARGAVVLAGGSGEEATLAFEPTVLELGEAHAKLQIMTEESFGPLLPIMVVPDADAAIRAANDSAFGLTTSIWTKRIKQAKGYVSRLKSGVVTINNHAFTAALPAAPWTGTGASGYGITNSPHALSAFVRVRFELVDRSSKKEVWWYPYTPTLRKLVFAMAKLRGGAGFFGKIGAFFSVLVNGPKRLLGR